MTRPHISFEFFPPKAGPAEDAFWATVARLGALQPDFISLTYGASGSDQSRSDSLVPQLQARVKAPLAAHITTVGASRDEIDQRVRGWAEAGVRRLVALRGDAPDADGRFRPHPGGYASAAELVAGLKGLGGFEIAVGCYPECHPEAPSPAADLESLKRKADAGADLAITQFFFEADTFLRFRDRAAAAGIALPIAAGIMPVFAFEKVAAFSARCGTSVPNWLAARFHGLDRDPATRDLVAATTAAALCQQLRAEGVDRFHFYTLNRAGLSDAVCRSLDLCPPIKKAA
jgi:methylenetetrahydrofolate reductase (NADPH)